MAGDTYPPVPGVTRVDLLQVSGDFMGTVDLMNTLYIRNTVDARVPAYFTDLAEAIVGDWEADLGPVYPDDNTLVGVRVTDLDTVGGISLEVSSSNSGDLTGDTTPLLACAVVQLFGAAEGEPRKSYLRHSPLLEADTEGNRMVAARRTAIDNAWSSFVQSISNHNVSDATVIISVYEPGAQSGPPPHTNIYRDEGVSNTVETVTVRQRVGRAVSRNK